MNFFEADTVRNAINKYFNGDRVVIKETQFSMQNGSVSIWK
jgi:hypothetical protein